MGCGRQRSDAIGGAKFKKDFHCECKLRSVPGAYACAWVLDTRAERLVGVRGSVN